MKIVTLNLRHGGASRMQAIIDFLERTRAQAIVCSEFRRNDHGKRLIDSMEKAGRKAFVSKLGDPKENGVAVFAASNAQPVERGCEPQDVQRIVACRVDGIVLTGVYFAQNRAKLSLFNYLLGEPFAGDEAIVIGDFNTGRHRVDETGATFHCAEEFGRLPSAGLHDLWRHHAGEDARDYSWYSNRGNPFRIDHAFGTDRVRSRVNDCSYDHSVRGTLTDHAALMLDLND